MKQTTEIRKGETPLAPYATVPPCEPPRLDGRSSGGDALCPVCGAVGLVAVAHPKGRGHRAKADKAKKESMLWADEWIILGILLLCFVLATLYFVSFLTGYFPSSHP